MKMKTKNFSLIVICLSALFLTGCWTTPDQGKVEVQTVWGKATKVVRPPGIWTVFVLGDDYHEVGLRSENITDVNIRASSNEPANFSATAQLVFSVIDDDASILAYVNKFGLTEEERAKRLVPQLVALLQAEYRNAASTKGAFELVKEQESIQKLIQDAMANKMKTEFFLKLESVQLGKPDFDNDAIDNASSQVVANQKLKEAAMAAFEAEKIEVERKKLAATTFQDPKMYELEKLRIGKEIAEAWAKHNGPLYFGTSPVAVFGSN